MIFVILIIFEIIIFASLGFIAFFVKNSGGSFGTDITSSIIVVFALAFLLTAAILAFYYLFTRYCMERRSKL
jgi:hypothetical protein